MKYTSKVLLFVFTVLFLVASVHAASPRDELKQLSTQLQSNPNDTALREKIIKLAQTIKPAPAMPEETQRRLGRGQAAFETAKEPADYDRAIAEFTAASNITPWLAAPYYNLGVAQEKAKKYRDAMASFRLYLLAAPAAADASEVKQRLFKLEYLAEQPPSDDELLKKVDGARFIQTGIGVPDDSIGELGYKINGKSVIQVMIRREAGPSDRKLNADKIGRWFRTTMADFNYKGRLRWEKTKEASCPFHDASCFEHTLEVSGDGMTLTSRFYHPLDRVPMVSTFPRSN